MNILFRNIDISFADSEIVKIFNLSIKEDGYDNYQGVFGVNQFNLNNGINILINPA